MAIFTKSECCGLTSRSIFCIGGSLKVIMKLHIYIYISICLLSGFNRVWFFVTPWTVVHQAPLSMEFSRQEHWSGLPFPSPAHWHVPPQNPLLPELQWWIHYLPWSRGGLLLSTGKVPAPSLGRGGEPWPQYDHHFALQRKTCEAS